MKNSYVLLILAVIIFSIFSCATQESDAPKTGGSDEGIVADEISTAEAWGGEKRSSDTDSEGALKEETPAEAVPKPSGESASLKAASASDEMPMLFAEEPRDSALPVSSPEASVPARSGLKAGFADDNRQYGYFLDFLEKYRNDITPLDLDVSERIILKVQDSKERSIPGLRIRVKSGGTEIEGVSLSDGSYQINPSGIPGDAPVSVDISGPEAGGAFEKSIQIDRDGEREIRVVFGSERHIAEPVPLDLVFVMDTTGSMGEEIQRLKDTIRIIHMNLSSLSVKASLRFGMVLYKDLGDEYDTKIIPLTEDLEAFQAELDLVEAYGGGDGPEDLEKALDDLVNGMDWREDGVRLAYIITDAPPHLDYGRDYRCEDAAADARRLGIKIYGIGTGGLDLQGEYLLRQIAQYTSARYIFLTYGEEGESGGGAPGSVSHHTGANWNADKLESIIIRFTREELSYLTDMPILPDEPWFEAGSVEDEKAEETLAKLFEQAVQQLVDYSSWPLTKESPVAVLPFSSAEGLSVQAEYFTEHFILGAGSNENITLAERKDLGQLMGEIEFQNLGVTDESTVNEIGELLNAEVLVLGNLFESEGKYELFLKMIRTGTAEVLSVTRAVIDRSLGL